MKTIIPLILTMISFSGFSQIIGIDYLHKSHIDYLNIICENDVVVKLKYPPYNYKDSLVNEANTISLLVNSAQRIINGLNLDSKKSYEIILEYPISCAGIVCKEKERFEVVVKEIDVNKYLAIKYGDSLIRKGVYLIHFKEDFVQIEISNLSQLDSIKKINFKAFFAGYTKYVNDNKLYKYDLKSEYLYSNKSFEKEYVAKIRKRKPYIAIRPSIGIGVGVIKGELVNNAGFLIETSFNDYSKYAIRLYGQYEFVTNYVDAKMFAAGFVNAGANLNLSDDYQPKDWLGFGIGVLVHRQAMSVFNQGTFKLFFERQIKIGLKIRPEIYYNYKDSDLFLGFMVSMNI